MVAVIAALLVLKLPAFEWRAGGEWHDVAVTQRADAVTVSVDGVRLAHVRGAERLPRSTSTPSLKRGLLRRPLSATAPRPATAVLRPSSALASRRPLSATSMH